MISPFDVTIIIPIYIKSQEYIGYLDECVKSCLATGARLLGYDDGSPIEYTQDNLEIIKCKENKGVSFARNELVKHVETHLFIPVDADDVVKPNYIEEMLKVYKNKPVYTDMFKFGSENQVHYTFEDFDRTKMSSIPGLCTTSVLQSVEMWYTIGGWNNETDYLEDIEYNHKLFMRFGGTHVKLPLYGWRKHDQQRTKINSSRRREQLQKILQNLGDDNMGCPTCGGKRRTVTNANRTATTTMTVPVGDKLLGLPLMMEGNVLVQYISGKGLAKHYKDLRDGTHRKLKYGDYSYIPEDCIDQDFLRVVKTPQKEEVVNTVAEKVEAIPEAYKLTREPIAEVKTIERKPVLYPDLPMPLNEMSIVEMRKISLTKPQAKVLLEEEVKGRDRAKFVEHFKGIIEA